MLGPCLSSHIVKMYYFFEVFFHSPRHRSEKLSGFYFVYDAAVDMQL